MRWSLRCLPTQTILGFTGSMICLQHPQGTAAVPNSPYGASLDCGKGSRNTPRSSETPTQYCVPNKVVPSHERALPCPGVPWNVATGSGRRTAPVGAGGRRAAPALALVPSSRRGAQPSALLPGNLGAEGDVPKAGPSRRDVGCRSALREWLCLLSLVLQNKESRAGVQLGKPTALDRLFTERFLPVWCCHALVKCPGCIKDQGWLWAHRLEEAGKGWVPGEQRESQILLFQPLCAHDLGGGCLVSYINSYFPKDLSPDRGSALLRENSETLSIWMAPTAFKCQRAAACTHLSDGFCPHQAVMFPL